MSCISVLSCVNVSVHLLIAVLLMRLSLHVGVFTVPEGVVPAEFLALQVSADACVALMDRRM